MKVVFSNANINKLVELIGENWVAEEFKKYKDSEPKDVHPLIHFLYTSQNVKVSRKTTPADIFFNMYFKDFQKFDGFSLKLIEHLPKISNRKKFISDLKNKDLFWSNIFEITTIADLDKSGYNIEKIPESKVKTPDFLCEKDGFIFTVESTNLNEPGQVAVERKASNYFTKYFIELFKHLAFNFRIRIVTSESLIKNATNIYTLALEVINNQREGYNYFNNNSISIFFEKTIFAKGEYHTLNAYLERHPLLSSVKSNCLTMFARRTIENNLVSDINEVAIHFDFDINKKILNTIFSKIDKGQEYKSLPKCIFCNVPHETNSKYIPDMEFIKSQIRKKIKHDNTVHTIVIFNESYSMIEGEGWRLSTGRTIVKTENTNAKGFKFSINLKEYEFGQVPRKYDELSLKEKSKVDNDINSK